MFNGAIFELLAAMDAVQGTASSTPLTTGWIDMAQLDRLVAYFSTGDMANETIDFAIQQATSNAGAGAKALDAIAQVAASAAGNDSKIYGLEVRDADLDVAGGFRFVRATITTGGATGGVASILALGLPRYRPASQVDGTKVTTLKA